MNSASTFILGLTIGFYVCYLSFKNKINNVEVGK
jgi:hypothetical protein